jgi:hypothetical protein
MKTSLKVLLLTVVYTALFVAANAVMPFSPGFKELGASGDPLSLLYMLVASGWTCFTAYYIIKHSRIAGLGLIGAVLFVLFFVQYFMTQIETLLFNDAFAALARRDVALIMLAGVPPLLGTVPLAAKFFKTNAGAEYSASRRSVKTILAKLLLIGVIYLCVYMLFGYFVAWQFEDLRLFYSGSRAKASFLGQMLNNMRTNPMIFPFQILRGILFGSAIVPLLFTLEHSRRVFITSVCLVYLSTAMVLIIPNVLFPDTVRLGHLIEMSTSMLLFGFIGGSVLWGRGGKQEARRLSLD